MKKQSEQLFNSITDIDDELVQEALEENTYKKQINWKPLLAIAACIVAFLIGSAVFHTKNFKVLPKVDFIPPKTGNYQSYAGPVLPLTMHENDSDVEAVRDINFDFSSYNSEETYEFYSTVSDKYQLTNKSTDKKTVEFLYPFAGFYAKLTELLPVIKKDGENISAELLAGNYAGGFLSDALTETTSNDKSFNLKDPENWEDYKELLKDGTYVENLFATTKSLDTPVTVYKFNEKFAMKDENVDLVVNLKFNPEKTQILSYGFNGGTFDDENNSRTYSASIPQDACQILIVIGNDLESYNVSKKNLKSGKSGLVDTNKVSRETLSLETVLADILNDYMQIIRKSYDTKLEPYAEEIYYRSFVEALTEYGPLSSKEIIRYSSSMLSDVLDDVFHQERVFYLKFTMELQPETETVLDFTLQKPYSHNFSCSGKETSHGYDFLTHVGSNLTFTGLSASITNAENITILEQNLGFDLENHVLAVPLDMKEEEYYLKIQ